MKEIQEKTRNIIMQMVEKHFLPIVKAAFPKLTFKLGDQFEIMLKGKGTPAQVIFNYSNRFRR